MPPRLTNFLAYAYPITTAYIAVCVTIIVALLIRN